MGDAHLEESPGPDDGHFDSDPLVEVLAALSPPGSIVRSGSRGDAAPSGATNLLEMVSVRQRSTLLPARSLPAAGVVLARARGLGLGRRERTLRIAAAAALASGAALMMNRRRVFVDASPDNSGTQQKSIDVHLSDILGRHVYCGLAQTSHYRANRKALLTVADRYGRVLAYCKIASNELTRELLQREANTLQALGQNHFEHLTLPSMLWTGDVGSLRLLLVSALKPPLLVPRAQHDRVLRAMTELSLSSSWPRTTLRESDWWANANRAINDAPDGEVRDSLGKSAELLANAFGNETFAFGRWHGDWTRWNTAETSRGVLAWDLERSQDLAPIGFDSVHSRLITLVDSDAPVSAFVSALDECAGKPCAVDGAQPAPSAAVTRAWLLALALRAVQDARVLPTPWAAHRVARVSELLSAASQSFIKAP